MADMINVVLRRYDLEPLSRGEVVHVPASSLAISIDEESRVLLSLVVSAELTDPRGVLDARLRRLELAIRKYIMDKTPANLDGLRHAYETTFTP